LTRSPCCSMREAFAIALVALDPDSIGVDAADLIVDWGGGGKPIIVAFRFCPFCGAMQSIDDQVEAYRDQEDM